MTSKALLSLTDTLGVIFPLQNGPLSDNGATQWVSAMGLGSPAQTLKFMIDSGTDNTWVTASACTTNACLAHNRFDGSQSTSYQVIDATPTAKSFGPWGTMTVIIAEDVFTIEQINLGQRSLVSTTEAMNFEAAIHYTGCQFQYLDCDGGIAVPSPYWKGDGRTEALMLQLVKDGKLSYPSAAFWTDPSSGVGACTWGCVDSSKYDPATLNALALIDVSSTGLGYLWAVNLGAFQINGQPVQATISSFVLDTGSSFFKGPQDLINTLVNAVTYNGELPSYVSSEQDLQQYPVIGLALGETTYYLSPEQYFLKLNDQYWELGIQVLDGMPEGMLLVGSMFLDTVYSIFDYGGSQVILANRI